VNNFSLHLKKYLSQNKIFFSYISTLTGSSAEHTLTNTSIYGHLKEIRPQEM